MNTVEELKTDGPGGELRLGLGVIVISGIKQNCTVMIMNNKSVRKTIPSWDLYPLNLNVLYRMC